MKHKVEFVFYSGEYPCLCHGVLVLKIDDVQYAFFMSKEIPLSLGVNKSNYVKCLAYLNEPNTVNVYRYDLISGGCAGVDDDLEEYCEEGEWKIDFSRAILDDDSMFQCDSDLLNQIRDCVNENVEHGCCGGCI